MGDRGRVPAGRKSRNLGRLWRLLVRGVAEVVLLVRPAVEETVETIEGGGEGVSDREGGPAGEGEPIMVVRVVVLREGRVSVELAVPRGKVINIKANRNSRMFQMVLSSS